MKIRAFSYTEIKVVLALRYGHTSIEIRFSHSIEIRVFYSIEIRVFFLRRGFSWKLLLFRIKFLYNLENISD